MKTQKLLAIMTSCALLWEIVECFFFVTYLSNEQNVGFTTIYL